MYTCKVCGKEFDDWHAVGGHMRKHTSKMKKEERREDDVEDRSMMLGKALGRLSELSAQEAWQIVVNWIMDVYRQKQIHDEILQKINDFRYAQLQYVVNHSDTNIQTLFSFLLKLRC